MQRLFVHALAIVGHLPGHAVTARDTHVHIGVGGIGKYSTSVFLMEILQYNYIPTILSKINS